MLLADNQEKTSLSSSTKVQYNGVERRGEHRRRILKGASVKFNNGFGNLECVLRDMTSNGARISMGHTSGMPSRVQLQVTGEKTPIEALVHWRTSRDFGVSFLLRGE